MLGLTFEGLLRRARACARAPDVTLGASACRVNSGDGRKKRKSAAVTSAIGVSFQDGGGERAEEPKSLRP